MKFLGLLVGVAPAWVLAGVLGGRDAMSGGLETPSYFPLHRMQGQGPPSQNKGLAPLGSWALTQYYAVVTIEGQDFKLIIDTGSSDTWVAGPDYQCQDENQQPQPRSVCSLGALYTPGPGFKQIPNQIFNLVFGSGQPNDGIFGNVNIAIGGITVNAQIAVAKHVANNGDNITSGVLGLSLPPVTSALRGNLPANGGPANNTDLYIASSCNCTQQSQRAKKQVPYDPVFFHMFKQNLVAPYFSITLNRRPDTPSDNLQLDDGYLALGSLPPVKIVGSWGIAPLQYVVNDNRYGYLATSLPYPQHEQYVFGADAYLYQAATPQHTRSKCKRSDWLELPYGTGLDYGSNLYNKTQPQVQFDTGYSYITLPPPTTDAFASKFIPPAIFNNGTGNYEVPCNAQVPAFAVQIGGAIIPIDKRDLILPNEDGSPGCFVTIQNGSTGIPYLLGDTFYQNAVVVHDLKNLEVRVAARASY